MELTSALESFAFSRSRAIGVFSQQIHPSFVITLLFYSWPFVPVCIS